jgi:hypothetical protein
MNYLVLAEIQGGPSRRDDQFGGLKKWAKTGEFETPEEAKRGLARINRQGRTGMIVRAIVKASAPEVIDNERF